MNAANPSLRCGGGVDGAIHAAAGPALLEERRALRRTSHVDGLAVGDAVATGAAALPARHVIHTAGPDRRAGQTDPALRWPPASPARSRSPPAWAPLRSRCPRWAPGSTAGTSTRSPPIAVAAVRETSAAGRAPGVELVRFALFGAEAHAAFREALAAPH